MKTSLLKYVLAAIFVSLVFVKESYASNNEREDTFSLKETSSSNCNSTDDDRRKIRLGFTAPSTMHRQLLLTEDENASIGIDWGYDGAYLPTEYDDIYWLIEGQFFTIQGTNVLDETSNFPLGFHTNESGTSTIGIDALENFSEDFNLYLYDNELEVYHNLRDSDYQFYSDAGIYLNRFSMVFNLPAEHSEVLSIDENEISKFKIYYNDSSNTLILNNTSSLTLKGISIYNIAGQIVHNHVINGFSTRQEINFNNTPAKGTYIVLIETDKGSISKKAILF